jgi:fructose/tagatose bisphosphate aldolase
MDQNPASNKILNIDSLIRKAVFGDDASRESARSEIRLQAEKRGIYPASIDGLYQAVGKNLCHGFSVPAINIRGITYDVARSVFRAAMKDKAGPFIFEIARSEIGYTQQKPAEYAACIFAAALRENYRGPVFIQGDHFQVNRTKFFSQPEPEIEAIRGLIRDAIAAGFYNIDIDASTVVDLDKPGLAAQQDNNSRLTAELTMFIREIQPKGVSVSVGGEIGEVGGRNSTVADLDAFMSEYSRYLAPGKRSLSKISVQTGTTHGGVVLPDGTVAKVEIDFKVLKELSLAARSAYGLAGAVQHGASTLPDSAFGIFPQMEAVEVHLATGFQNIIFDSQHFPQELRSTVNKSLLSKYASERKPKDTDEQHIYKTRKKAFGDFKKELWGLPEATLKTIGGELEERFSFLFHQLKVNNTADLIKSYITRS